MKTKIYLHIAVMGHFNQIVTKLLNKINLSGLYNKANEINLNVCGDGSLLDIKKMPKYNITNETQDIKKCEFPTLDKIWKDAQTEKFKVLYLHTKGVSREEKNKCMEDWIEYLSYFNIEKWEDRISDLERFDASGVDLKKNPKWMGRITKENEDISNQEEFHYSGNFWWSNSNHIKNLPSPTSLIKSSYYKSRHLCEMWVCANTKKLYNAWTSNVWHYNQRYQRGEYEK